MPHLDDDDLVLHYYGEMDTAADERAGAHLGSCGECSQRYTRLQRVLAAVDTMPAPVLPEGFERTVWARLEPALPTRRSWLPRLLAATPNLAWAATIVLLVIGAFFAGRVSQQPGAGGEMASAEEIREGVLLADLTEHLDRSQAMLVELVSGRDPGVDQAVDMSLERGRAEDLVSANRLYRQTAMTTGDVTIAELLDDLERLLVELAVSPDRVSGQDMELIKQRIVAKDLLFKVRIVSSAVRERQKEQIRVRVGQSS